MSLWKFGIRIFLTLDFWMLLLLVSCLAFCFVSSFVRCALFAVFSLRYTFIASNVLSFECSLEGSEE